MSIYKVLIMCSKEVPTTTPSGHTYNEQQRAYAEYQYFSSLEKAEIFVQRYSEFPLVWECISDDCYCTEHPLFSANIYVEKDAYFDTTLLPPLPTKFAPTRHSGD